MKTLVSATFATALLLSGAAQAQMNVKEIGSFHIGGQQDVLEGPAQCTHAGSGLSFQAS